MAGLTPDDARHGTATGYKHHGCRCDACKTAWAADHRAYMHRTGRSTPHEVYIAERRDAASQNHGTEGTYKRCKCTICRRAATVARKARQWENIEHEREMWRERKRRRRLQAKLGSAA